MNVGAVPSRTQWAPSREFSEWWDAALVPLGSDALTVQCLAFMGSRVRTAGKSGCRRDKVRAQERAEGAQEG